MHKSLKEKLIKYFESLGLEVSTDTNAHGNKGYFSNNKIEISSTIKKRKFVPTLLHEFSHYIHMKIEQNLLQTGGNINAIFDLPVEDNNGNKIGKILQEELLLVTNFVDKSSSCNLLKSYIGKLNNKIDKLEYKIKQEYPDFKKTKKNNDFGNFTNTVTKKAASLSTPKVFLSYNKLIIAQREKRRIYRCIDKYKKYYSTPTELFARFIEGLYIDYEKVKKIAPEAFKRFFNLLESGYYYELKNIFQIMNQSKRIFSD